MAFRAVQIGNNQNFNKALFIKIENSNKRYLLVPKCLYPKETYEDHEWFSNESLEFYSCHDYYLLSSFTAIPGDIEGIDNTVAAYEVIKDARNVLFPISKMFGKVLTPHTYKDFKKIFDTSFLHEGIWIHPKLRESGVQNSSLKFELSKKRFEGQHPVFNILQQAKRMGFKINAQKLIETLNQYIMIEKFESDCMVVGAVIDDFLEEVEEKVDSLTIGSFNLQDVANDVRARLDNDRFYEYIAEYVLTKKNKINSTILGQKKSSRRYYEFGGFDPVCNLKELDCSSLEPLLTGEEELLKATSEFIDSRSARRYRSLIQNMLYFGLETTKAENIFQEIRRENTDLFNEIVLPEKKYNELLLTYYFEAQSLDRPAGAYQKLFNIIEAFMIDSKTHNSRSTARKKIGKKATRKPTEIQLVERILKSKCKISDLKVNINDINACDFSGYIDDTIKLNWKSISRRIYNLRCSIVHSKSKDHKIAPFSHEEFTVIPPHTALLDTICMQIIEDTGIKINIIGLSHK